MKIRLKLTIPIIGSILISFLCIQLFISFGLQKYENFALNVQKTELLNGYKKELKSSTEIAVSLIEAVYKRQDISDEEKLTLSAELVRPLKFGTDGYFYAYTQGDGINIIHGANIQNEGKSLWDLQSPDKTQYIIRELDKVATDGSDFLNFYWSKPGTSDTVLAPKIGTAIMVPGTNIWVGAGAYIDDIDLEIEKNTKIMVKFYNQLALSLMIFMFIATIVLFILITRLIKGVITPVTRLSKIAKDSEGTDFRIIPTVTKRRFTDEVSVLEESFAQLLIQFSTIINGVQHAVSSSIESSLKMEKSLREINNNLGESESSLLEIAASEKQLSSEANEHLKISLELKEFVDQIKNSATEQSEKVNEASLYINEMQDEIQDVDKVINDYTKLTRDLEDSARNGFQSITTAAKSLEKSDIATSSINDAIKLITDLTEKTNILAINASIEAARAGDVGKGFGVVAHEIRSLAEDSSKNMDVIGLQLKDIARSIKGSKESTNQAESTFLKIQNMSKDVLIGTEQIAENNRSISGKSSGINDILSKLTVSAKETESSSIRAFDQVNIMEVSASELNQLAENLQKTVQNVEESINKINRQSSVILDESSNNNKKMNKLKDSVSIFKTALTD